MENKDNMGKVKGVNECVGDKVEENGRKMSVKNSTMTMAGAERSEEPQTETREK